LGEKAIFKGAPMGGFNFPAIERLKKKVSLRRFLARGASLSVITLSSIIKPMVYLTTGWGSVPARGRLVMRWPEIGLSVCCVRSIG